MTAPQTVFPLRSATGVALVAATVFASMIGFLDAYMINVAVPAIGRDLNADVSALQWVLTGYLVTVAALLCSPVRSPTTSDGGGS
jgi:MFS family permease